MPDQQIKKQAKSSNHSSSQGNVTLSRPSPIQDNSGSTTDGNQSAVVTPTQAPSDTSSLPPRSFQYISRQSSPRVMQPNATSPQQPYSPQDPYGWDDWGYGADQSDAFGPSQNNPMFNQLSESMGYPPRYSQTDHGGRPHALTPEERGAMIEKVYQEVLFRKPDTRDMNYYKYSTLDEDHIKKQLMTSAEFKETMTRGRDYLKMKEHADQLETRVRMLEGQIKDQVEEFRELNNLLQEKNRHLQLMRTNCMPSMPARGGEYTYREDEGKSTPDNEVSVSSPATRPLDASAPITTQQTAIPEQRLEPSTVPMPQAGVTTKTMTPLTQEVFIDESKDHTVAASFPTEDERSTSDVQADRTDDNAGKSFFKSIF